MADASLIASADAISLGLIVTELVINPIKYAFPHTRPDARILITYETRDSDWALIVTDNGVGKAEGAATAKGGLGTAIVNALAKQLGAQIDIKSTHTGMTVAVIKATFTSRLPQAA